MNKKEREQLVTFKINSMKKRSHKKKLHIGLESLQDGFAKRIKDISNMAIMDLFINREEDKAQIAGKMKKSKFLSSCIKKIGTDLDQNFHQKSCKTCMV